MMRSRTIAFRLIFTCAIPLCPRQGKSLYAGTPTGHTIEIRPAAERHELVEAREQRRPL